MISYREKQLLMVMKMLQDDTQELKDTLLTSLDAVENKRQIQNNVAYSKATVAEYEQLIDIAEARGYEIYVRAEDLLSAEELLDLERRKEEIDTKFRELTRLHKVDYAFLFAAIALQITRQALQPRLDFETLMKAPSDRDGDKASKNKVDSSKTEEKVNKHKEKASDAGIQYEDREEAQEREANGEQPWHASLEYMLKDLGRVPYDAHCEGMNWNHRYKTLGHDPWLGYLFGSCNILTNTLTTNKMITYQVDTNKWSAIQPGSLEKTGKMIHYSCERFKAKGGKPVVAIALAKQAYHIQTDVKSKKGIPLPFLQLFLDAKTINKLCSMGIDYNAMQFAGGVAKQAVFAEMINFIVATSHRILIAKEEFLKFCDANNLTDDNSIVDALRQKGFHNIIFGDETLNEVRTRKILLISNTVASSANIIYVGIAAGASGYTGNTAGVYEALSKLDVGGILITLKHLFTDGRVIAKIKDDFIKNAITEEFNNKMKAIEEINY